MAETENRIELAGGAFFVTQEAADAFRVTEGPVLVYLMKMRQEEPGRRILLHEAPQGTLLPALNYTDDEGERWCFGLAALEHAALERLPGGNGAAVQDAFVQNAGIRLYGAARFEEQMAEHYQLRLVREEGDIFAAEKERKEVYAKGLDAIYALFSRQRRRHSADSPSPRYNAVATLCGHMGIRVVPYLTLHEEYGQAFTVRDIARLSHFTCRDILLEPGWYKKDAGPFLAFTADGGHPVPCLPKGPTRYEALDPATDTLVPVTAAFAATLSPRALMLYRPLPPKPVGPKELFLFGLRGLHTRDVLTFLLMALAGALVGMLIPALTQLLYDRYIPTADALALVETCAVALACILGNVCFTIVKNLATFRGMSAMQFSVQSAVYDRLFNMPESFFRHYDSADLAQRAMGVGGLYGTMLEVAAVSLFSAVFSLMYLLQMFRMAGSMAGAALGMTLLSAAVVMVIGLLQVRHQQKLAQLGGELSSLMYQLLGGIAKVRNAGVEDRALYQYLKPYTTARSLSMRNRRLDVLSAALVSSLTVICSIVLYLMMLSGRSAVSTGSFIGFMAAFGMFSGAMLQIAQNLILATAMMPLYQRAKPLLQTLPEFEDGAELPGPLHGDIEVNNVTFAYDKEAGNVLEDISLHIHAGEYVGIVGSTGSGKSTLLKLLLGFNQPSTGKIYYDKQDIDRMDKRELRKKMGVVLQDGRLIAGSIYENITITAPGATLQQVEEVAKQVGLWEDIQQMPMGFHTLLSEDSDTISGGQQQRILIARAIIGNPRILLFDEATSALDNTTQAKVVESLNRLQATRIVIAHRLSTVADCDRILVMHHGRLVEQGSYSQLMEKRGRFYELASRQIT